MRRSLAQGPPAARLLIDAFWRLLTRFGGGFMETLTEKRHRHRPRVDEKVEGALIQSKRRTAPLPEPGLRLALATGLFQARCAGRLYRREEPDDLIVLGHAVPREVDVMSPSVVSRATTMAPESETDS